MSTPSQAIWSDAVADAVGKAKQTTAPLTGSPSGSASIWADAVNDARGIKQPAGPAAQPKEPEPGFWRGSPSVPGLPMMESQTMTPQKMQQGAMAAGETALAGGVAGGAALGGVALAGAAPAVVSTVGDLAAAHPVAAYLIKRLLAGGMLKAGWEATKILGGLGKAAGE